RSRTQTDQKYVAAVPDCLARACAGRSAPDGDQRAPGPTRRRTLRWPMWPTGRPVAILDIEIRPPKDRSQESSCPDAVRTAGWWSQQAAQRLRAVRNRGHRLHVEAFRIG